jgi:hypothetical protein
VLFSRRIGLRVFDTKRLSSFGFNDSFSLSDSSVSFFESRYNFGGLVTLIRFYWFGLFHDWWNITIIFMIIVILSNNSVSFFESRHDFSRLITLISFYWFGLFHDWWDITIIFVINVTLSYNFPFSESEFRNIFRDKVSSWMILLFNGKRFSDFNWFVRCKLISFLWTNF